jgi:hypothetical protein
MYLVIKSSILFNFPNLYELYNQNLFKKIISQWSLLCNNFFEYHREFEGVFKKALKGQWHEIFDPRFFCQSINPRPQINTLKYFRILFRIR